jgi:SAM-dependent methyltransferase
VDTGSSYDAVADVYVERFLRELDHKPFDRERLDDFARRVRGRVADVGCGPGHIARWLHERGVEVCGVDLSGQMIERARELLPGLDFEQGDMAELDFEPGSLGGIVAFYSIIHIARERVTGVLRGFARALRPGGLLLMSFHLGDHVVHLDEWWDREVSVDFFFFGMDEMRDYLARAGFELLEARERNPYAPEVEGQTRRGYLLARRPETP